MSINSDYSTAILLLWWAISFQISVTVSVLVVMFLFSCQCCLQTLQQSHQLIAWLWKNLHMHWHHLSWLVASMFMTKQLLAVRNCRGNRSKNNHWILRRSHQLCIHQYWCLRHQYWWHSDTNTGVVGGFDVISSDYSSIYCLCSG